MKPWKENLLVQLLLCVICGALSFFWFFFYPYTLFTGWADIPLYTVIILVAVLLAYLLLDVLARVPAIFVLVGFPVQCLLAFLLGDVFGRAVGLPDSTIAFYGIILAWEVTTGALAVTAAQFAVLLPIQLIRKYVKKRLS